MTLLAGFKVVQIGGGAAVAVCGRLLADVGAEVTCVDPGSDTTLLAYLNHGKAPAMPKHLEEACLIVSEDGAHALAELRRLNGSATISVSAPASRTAGSSDSSAMATEVP